ncbi:hypothetical protein D6D13_02636 [Aureobasidium pullulans]|uniref:BTB domain-containing protein n=1 Tax=Aureobasidium pullulans TaxID=5580 RepID=A0A4S9D4B2_AURPU|nr:hypothetical protein D6D13_02636 [Aureobasidium pullulans]
MATQARKNDMGSSTDWSSHMWSPREVYAAVTKSPETIKLVSKKGKTTVSVHKELLCFFSPYYKAALKGNFTEAITDSLQVDLTNKGLKMFVRWIYTGEVASPRCFARYFNLYIFADLVNIVALRRTIMTRLQGYSEDIPEYSAVKLALMNLPESSPLRAWILDVYISHWEPAHDDCNPYPTDTASDPDNTLAAFMYQVARGLAVRESVNAAGCLCCDGDCGYHEHESMAEWEATCGQIEDMEMPEDLE